MWGSQTVARIAKYSCILDCATVWKDNWCQSLLLERRDAFELSDRHGGLATEILPRLSGVTKTYGAHVGSWWSCSSVCSGCEYSRFCVPLRECGWKASASFLDQDLRIRFSPLWKLAGSFRYLENSRSFPPLYFWPWILGSVGHWHCTPHESCLLFGVSSVASGHQGHLTPR